MKFSFQLLAFITIAVCYFFFEPFAEARLKPLTEENKNTLTRVLPPKSAPAASPKSAVPVATHHHHARRVVIISESDWGKTEPAKPVSPKVKEALVDRNRVPASIDNKFRDLD